MEGGGMMGGNYEGGSSNEGHTSTEGHHSGEWGGMGMGGTGMCANGTDTSGWGFGDGDNYGDMGGMGGGDQASAIIHLLFENHLLMERNVAKNGDGSILTTTTSNDATVASLLREHVQTMLTRLEENRLIRQCDPFFVELFNSHDEYSALATNITEGVQVHLSASTPCGQALIEEHTSIVSKFVETGMTEAMTAHSVPSVCIDETSSTPVPASGSSIVANTTSDTPPASGSSLVANTTSDTPPASGISLVADTNSDTSPSSLGSESTSSACSTNKLLLVALGFATACALSMGL